VAESRNYAVGDVILAAFVAYGSRLAQAPTSRPSRHHRSFCRPRDRRSAQRLQGSGSTSKRRMTLSSVSGSVVTPTTTVAERAFGSATRRPEAL